MRVLLIQAHLGRPEPPVAPLGLASLATYLKPHQVKIFDPNIVAHPIKETCNIIEDSKPDIVGFSLRNVDTTKYNDQFLYLEHFQNQVKTAKEIRPSTPFVVGGSGFSLFPTQILRRIPEIEAGFFLEAESSFSRFLKNGGQADGTPGLFVRSGGQIEFTGSPEWINLEDILPPAWEQVNLTAYVPFSERASIGVEAKRGCPLQCAYCTYPQIGGAELRKKAPGKVVDELEAMKEKFAVQQIFFCDPVFNYPLEHAEAICRQILNRNLSIKWGAYHQDRFLTPEYVELARESGCQDFYFSPDAASERGLKILNKVTTVESLNRSLNLIAADGLARASYNFFAAIPGTGWENWLAALRFLLKAKLKLGKRLTRWKLSYMRLEPHTPTARAVFGPKADGDGASLLPSSVRNLDGLFYRRSSSVVLDVVLWLHFCLGKLFGRRNVIED